MELPKNLIGLSFKDFYCCYSDKFNRLYLPEELFKKETELSESFTLKEFKCKCVNCMGIREKTKKIMEQNRATNKDRAPEVECIIFNNLKGLCNNVLQKIRDRFGIVHINSGYRCWPYNEVEGGVYNSQHMLGEAADIPFDREKSEEVYKWVKNKANDKKNSIVFDQLILYPWGVHVSYKTNTKKRGPNRRCAFEEGKGKLKSQCPKKKPIT